MKHILKDTFLLETDIHLGAVVTTNGSLDKFGVVCLIEEDDVTVYWSNDTEEVVNKDELSVMDFETSLQSLNAHKDSKVFSLWVEILNGKNDDLDIPCLYIGDMIFNKVEFIKYYKMSKRVIDKRFQRELLFHKKIGNYRLYKASTCTLGENANLELDRNSFAYYILSDDNLYFIGVKTDINNIISFLYNNK